MADAAAWMRSPSSARSGWSARPRFALSDFPTLLWRERWLMLLIFLAVLIAGLAASMMLHKSYTAGARLLVRAGEEYVYQPFGSDVGRGATPDADQLVQSEAAILESDALRRRVIGKLGISAFDDKLASDYAIASPAKKEVIMSRAVRALSTGLAVQTVPQNAVIGVTFEHKNPQTAARVLNTLLEEYLIYRRAVLAGGDTSALARQREALERRLQEADTAYEGFLTGEGVGDFEAEKASLSQLQAALEQKAYDNKAALDSRIGRLASLGGQIQAVAPEVGLYRDANPAPRQKLTELRVQRANLLARYRPEAQPVRQLDAEIARLEASINAGQTVGDDQVRYGVNPVFQTLQTENIQLSAEISALQKAQATLESQLSEVRTRRLRMASLEPRNQELARERDVLQSTVRDISLREQAADASRQVAVEGSDSVRILERATPPMTGKSLRRPVAVLAFLFAGFTALCAGLLRIFLRPGLATRESAARTFDLPVLGSAQLKAA